MCDYRSLYFQKFDDLINDKINDKMDAISINRSSRWTIERNEDEKHANMHYQILISKLETKVTLLF